MNNKKNIPVDIILLLLIIIVGCEEQVTAPENNDPIITSINAFPTSVQLSDSFAVVCSAYDPDGDTLVYDWFCTSGASIKGVEPSAPSFLYHTKENIRIFYSPDSVINQIDTIRITCDVRDVKGGGKSAWLFVAIIQ